MSSINFRTQVPARPEQVFERIFGLSAVGPHNMMTLEDKYGKQVGQDEQGYTFLSTPDENDVRLKRTFDPPRHHAERTLGLTGVDRFDWFEPSEEGTLWTVRWDFKTTGLSLMYKIRFRLFGIPKFIYYDLYVKPILEYFAQAAG